MHNFTLVCLGAASTVEQKTTAHNRRVQNSAGWLSFVAAT